MPLRIYTETGLLLHYLFVKKQRKLYPVSRSFPSREGRFQSFLNFLFVKSL